MVPRRLALLTARLPRSDQAAFLGAGVPSVLFSCEDHEDYHQVTDTPDKLDYGKMERVGRLAFWTGWRATGRWGWGWRTWPSPAARWRR